MEIIAIPKERISSIWMHVEGLVRRVNEKREPWWRLQNPREKCENGHAQLWIAWDGKSVKAIVITQITVDAEPVCELALCSGDGRDEWLPFLPVIEMWAKEQGCTALIGYARQGWSKVLAGQNFTERARLIEKRL
jgi:hypothetical protein